MGSEVYNLAILLSLRDAASGGLDRASAKIRMLGKDGKLLSETFDKLRADLNRDLTIGGVGIGGLMLLKKGVDEAGNFEEALLGVRQAYQENARFSTYSADQQEQQIKRIMVMATELGNKLEGTTGDYANIFTAMNKAGIDAETTLNGAGKAAAYLANVTGAIRNGQAPQLAQDLGSYGKMFDLQGQEYIKAVQTFSAIKDRFNLDSGNLIEASKYFFSTAKGTLNLRGFEGSQETAKLFAFAKRYAGREGSEAGTSLDALITQFVAHKEKLEALSKDKGIKLEFFDTKGNFQGVENMFAQLEKMKKLNPEERAERLNGIFGEQGARIANAMVEQGVEGWRNITAEMNKSVDVQTLINQKMESYNAKSEALSGSWTNFKATAFTPLMESTKQFLDLANSIVTKLQEFSAAHPGLTKTLGTLAAYGTTALVVYSGFKTLTTGVKMFRLASAFSRGEGLIPYLNGTATAANAASASMSTATGRAVGLRNAMQRIANNSTIRIGVTIASIMGLEYAITNAIQSYMAADTALKSRNQAIRANAVITNNALNSDLSVEEKQKLSVGEASTSLFSLRQAGLLQTLGLESPKGWGEWVNSKVAVNPFENGWKNYDRQKAATAFQTNAPTLSNSSVMREFLKMLPERIPGNDAQSVKAREEITKTAQLAFPDSFKTAMQELSALSFAPLTQSFSEFSQSSQQLSQQTQSTVQSLSELQQPFYTTQQNVTNLGDAANKVPSPLNQVATSANSASSSLNLLSAKIDNWQMPTPQIQTYQVPVPQGDGSFPSAILPSRAIGGIVERDGLAMVHAGNIITPAKVTKGLKVTTANFGDSVQASSGPFTLHYAPNLTVNGSDKNAAQKFRAMLYEHKKDLERIIAERMNNGRIRA